MSERVALLGGTFNPIHYGHLHIAAVALATGSFDRVVLVPTFLPAHKPGSDIAAPNHRLAMIRAAIAGEPRLGVDDLELTRGGVSYTIDTVRELGRRRAVGDRPGLIIGDDLIAELHSWREAAALWQLVEVLVARRLPAPPPEVPVPCYRRLDNELLPLSSTALRQRVGAGQSIRFLVPDVVDRYIRERKLYA